MNTDDFAMVKPDPLGDPFVLLVRSKSKPGKWHSVKWYVMKGDKYVFECDSGFCERDFFRPSQECRHEREALAYLRRETLEAQLARSIEYVKEKRA